MTMTPNLPYLEYTADSFEEYPDFENSVVGPIKDGNGNYYFPVLAVGAMPTFPGELGLCVVKYNPTSQAWSKSYTKISGGYYQCSRYQVRLEVNWRGTVISFFSWFDNYTDWSDYYYEYNLSDNASPDTWVNGLSFPDPANMNYYPRGVWQRSNGDKNCFYAYNPDATSMRLFYSKRVGSTWTHGLGPISHTGASPSQCVIAEGASGKLHFIYANYASVYYHRSMTTSYTLGTSHVLTTASSGPRAIVYRDNAGAEEIFFASVNGNYIDTCKIVNDGAEQDYLHTNLGFAPTKLRYVLNGTELRLYYYNSGWSFWIIGSNGSIGSSYLRTMPNNTLFMFSKVGTVFQGYGSTSKVRFYQDIESLVYLTGSSDVKVTNPGSAFTTRGIPITDTTLASWRDLNCQNTNIFTQINEIAFDDPGWIMSPNPPVGQAYKCKLSAVGPGPVQLSYRYKKVSPYGSSTIIVTLWEGTTQITSWTHNDADTNWKQADHLLSNYRSGLITDRRNIYITIQASS